MPDPHVHANVIMTTKQKQKNKELNSYSRKTKRNFMFYLGSLNRMLMVLILLSCGYFVLSINDLAIKGFILQDLKKETNKLQVISKDLELSVTNFESFENIQKRAEELKMVRVEKIDYISISKGGVAKK